MKFRCGFLLAGEFIWARPTSEGSLTCLVLGQTMGEYGPVQFNMDLTLFFYCILFYLSKTIKYIFT